MLRALALLLALMLATVAPAAQGEHRCDTRVSVESRTPFLGGPPTASYQGGSCTRVLGTSLTETRYLTPNATEVKVRYHGDFGAGVPTLAATLDGLGFANASATLLREPTTIGWQYESAWMRVPHGEDARGTLVANVTTPLGYDHATYRTFTPS